MKQYLEFRGLTKRLLEDYLVDLGGRRVGEGRFEGPGWQARFTSEKVQLSGLSLTQFNVTLEGEEEILPAFIERLRRKAMRGGG